MVPSDLLTSLRQTLRCPSLDFVTNEAWSAKSLNYRDEIRSAIAARFDATETPKLRDLSQPPAVQSHSISISHHPSLGGFALVEHPVTIGFDLELRPRIANATVARVCTIEEAQQAPEPCCLWVAKEAAYKALQGPKQPQLVSDLLVGDWSSTTVSSRNTASEVCIVWTYTCQLKFDDSAHAPIGGIGVVFSISNDVFGFFAKHSST